MMSQPLATARDVPLTEYAIQLLASGHYEVNNAGVLVRSQTLMDVNMLRVKDLTPLYAVSCAKNSMVVFCEDPSGKVHKYTMIYPTWCRAQCVCCRYKEYDTGVDKIPMPVFHDKEAPVNLELCNYTQLIPVFSKFCETASQSVLYAAKNPEMKDLTAWRFCPLMDCFIRSPCRDFCCKDLPIQTPLAFIHGSQNPHYARKHRDIRGRPLMAVYAKWTHESKIVFQTFINTEGEVGDYKWEESFEGYQLVKQYETRTFPYQPIPPQAVVRPIRFDDGLRVMFVKRCPTLNCLIFFCIHFSDYSLRKYTYNPVSEQFDVICCPCCSFQNPMMILPNGKLMSVNSPITGATYHLQKLPDGQIHKSKLMTDQKWITLERAPIRVMESVPIQNYILIRDQEFRNCPKMTQTFIDGKEAWHLTRPFKAEKDQKAILVAEMDGSIKRHYLTEEDQNPEEDQRNFAVHTDLSVAHTYPCSHLNQQIYQCFNEFTKTTGSYYYDSTSGLIRECPFCQTCFVENENENLGTNFTMGSTTPNSKHGCIVRIHEQKILILTKNEKTNNFDPVEPMRILKWEHDVSIAKKVVLPAPRNLEKELEEMTEKFKAVSVQNESLSNEINRLHANSELEKVADSANPSLASTDFDLIPEFRNYCHHTENFFITAFNIIEKKTDHYVYNPKTSRFHPADYCNQCPPFSDGVNIFPSVNIMTVQSESDPLWPILIEADSTGRLVKIGLERKDKRIHRVTPELIKERLTNLAGIKSTIIPVLGSNAPQPHADVMDNMIIPKNRYFCVHADDYLLEAHNTSSDTYGCYIFRRNTGFLEEHLGCLECRKNNFNSAIGPKASIFPVTSPLSNWALYLTTDSCGQYTKYAFDPTSKQFKTIQAHPVKMLSKYEPAQKMRKEENVKECQPSTSAYSANNGRHITIAHAIDQQMYRIDAHIVQSEASVRKISQFLECHLPKRSSIKNCTSSYNEPKKEDQKEEEVVESMNGKNEADETESVHHEESDASEDVDDEEYDDEEYSDEEYSDEEYSDEECSDEEYSDEECSDEEEDQEDMAEEEEVLDDLSYLEYDDVSMEEDAESTATAIDGKDELDESMTESTSTAIEDDAESTATAVEPADSLDQNLESMTGSTSTAIEDDAESTATAVEPADSLDEDHESMTGSTSTAIEDDAESTATAVEPADSLDQDLELIKPEDVEDDVSTVGSDISLLSDFASVKSLDSDLGEVEEIKVEDSVYEDAEEPKGAEPNGNGCAVS